MQDVLTTAATVVEIAVAVLVLVSPFLPKQKAEGRGQEAAVPTSKPADMPVCIQPAKPSRTEELRAKFGTTLVSRAPISPITAEDVEAALQSHCSPAPLPASPSLFPTTSSALRKLCTELGIAWAHYNGRNRHMTRDQMLTALAQPAAA